MIIETERFGSIDMDNCRVLHFAQGLPGFEELKEFVILEADESKPLYWLQSTENMHICLPVIIPFELMDDYFIEIRDNELSELGISNESDLLLMNVVVIPTEFEKMTANMAAPLVVNAKLGIGKQIIIDSKDLSVRYPIYDIIMQKLKGVEADVGAVSKEG